MYKARVEDTSAMEASKQRKVVDARAPPRRKCSRSGCRPAIPGSRPARSCLAESGAPLRRRAIGRLCTCIYANLGAVPRERRRGWKSEVLNCSITVEIRGLALAIYVNSKALKVAAYKLVSNTKYANLKCEGCRRRKSLRGRLERLRRRRWPARALLRGGQRKCSRQGHCSCPGEGLRRLGAPTCTTRIQQKG